MQDPFSDKSLTRAVVFAMILFAGLCFLLGATAGAAWGHEGDHPLACEDVEVPEGYDCHDAGTYDQPVWQNMPDPEWHTVCTRVGEGAGSSAGEPYFAECLPETGSSTGLLGLMAGLAVIGGASLLTVTRGDA